MNLDRFLFRLFGLLLLAATAFGCTASRNAQTRPSPSAAIVGRVGAEKITYDELRAHYQPLQNETQPTDSELVSFLPTYLNYKAKVKEAKAAGYFEQQEIRKEYADYARRAANSYWLENEVNVQLLNEFYQRSQEEVQVSHLLIALRPDASPEDTARAYSRLMEARRKFLAGQADFNTLNQEYSTVSRGRPMGGKLGYFSAGTTVKPFEDVAYSLPVDSVSYPFRTRFGYHLLYLQDRRERKPDRLISQIFLQTRNGDRSIDSSLAIGRDIYHKLKKGADWNAMVQQYSEDPRSRAQGGKVGWMNYGRYPMSLIDTVMALPAPGAFTHPFYSGYGVQIIRLDSIRQYASKTAEKQALLQKLKQLPRYRDNQALVNQRVREAGNEQLHVRAVKAVQGFLRTSDSTHVHAVQLPDSLKRLAVYSLDGMDYSGRDYLEWLKQNRPGAWAGDVNPSWMEDFRNSRVDEHIVDITGREFPEFRRQAKNYLDGLAVFKITEDSVWNAAQTDTAALRALYRAHPDNYRFGRRYKFYMLSAPADSALRQARRMITAGTQPDSLEARVRGLTIRGEVTEYIDQPPLEKLKPLKPGSFTEPFEYKYRQTILYLADILEPRRMTFDEAINKLSTEYQPRREAQWLRHLQQKYNIQTYTNRLRNVLEAENAH